MKLKNILLEIGKETQFIFSFSVQLGLKNVLFEIPRMSNCFHHLDILKFL